MSSWEKEKASIFFTSTFRNWLWGDRYKWCTSLNFQELDFCWLASLIGFFKQWNNDTSWNLESVPFNLETSCSLSQENPEPLVLLDMHGGLSANSCSHCLVILFFTFPKAKLVFHPFFFFLLLLTFSGGFFWPYFRSWSCILKCLYNMIPCCFGKQFESIFKIFGTNNNALEMNRIKIKIWL